MYFSIFLKKIRIPGWYVIRAMVVTWLYHPKYFGASFLYKIYFEEKFDQIDKRLRRTMGLIVKFGFDEIEYQGADDNGLFE